MMMKGATPAIAKMLAEAEMLAKGIDPEKEHTTMAITKEVRDALPEEVRKEIERLEAVETSAADAIAKAAAGAGGTVDPDAEAFEKALASMAPEVRDTFRKQQEETAATRRMAKALIDEREDGKFEEIAKGLLNLPGVASAEFGPVLRKAAEASGAEVFDPILKVLKAADAAIKESGLFKEIGTGHGGAADGSPLATIEGFAKSLQEKDPDLTYAAAIEKAATDHPELYAAHREGN